MRIAGHDVGTPLVLSPMVDVTDAAFRSIARDWGADVTCSEMVAAVGLLHDHPKAWSHVEPWPGEGPYGVQFMTRDPDELAAAVRHLATRVRPDFIDVNLGCPAPNILRSCAGGFLMQNPKLAGKVIRAAKNAADDAGIPHVSVKMRLGPDDGRMTYLTVGEEAESAGASWVTLHARTVAQGYAGKARWEHIRLLVEALAIPVIGNGDLRTPEDVLRMRDETGCAGFFIARAAMHDPTVFRRMRTALDGHVPADDPPLRERLATLIEYLDRAAQIGITDASLLRRQAMRFVAGAPGAKRLRVALQPCRDDAAIRDTVATQLAAS